MNRVLIVDDEAGVLDVAAAMVGRLGFVPLMAGSAQSAITIYQEKHPGIVLTDLNLDGEMDGVALCSWINNDDKSVIVIAMSGYFSEYDKIFCLAAGFSDFLSKPVKLKDMDSALRCAFDRRMRWTQLP